MSWGSRTDSSVSWPSPISTSPCRPCWGSRTVAPIPAAEARVPGCAAPSPRCAGLWVGDDDLLPREAADDGTQELVKPALVAAYSGCPGRGRTCSWSPARAELDLPTSRVRAGWTLAQVPEPGRSPTSRPGGTSGCPDRLGGTGSGSRPHQPSTMWPPARTRTDAPPRAARPRASRRPVDGHGHRALDQQGPVDLREPGSDARGLELAVHSPDDQVTYPRSGPTGLGSSCSSYDLSRLRSR